MYVCVCLCVCLAEVLCYGGGTEGGGGGAPGSTGKGGRSAKEEIEEMNKAACIGAVHRSAGARSVGLLGQEKRCSVVYGEKSHNPGRLAMGPYLLYGGRTAVCCSNPISIERAYCGMVEEAISQTGPLRGVGPEGLCWGGGQRARSHLRCLSSAGLWLHR